MNSVLFRVPDYGPLLHILRTASSKSDMYDQDYHVKLEGKNSIVFPIRTGGTFYLHPSGGVEVCSCEGELFVGSHDSLIVDVNRDGLFVERRFQWKSGALVLNWGSDALMPFRLHVYLLKNVGHDGGAGEARSLLRHIRKRYDSLERLRELNANRSYIHDQKRLCEKSRRRFRKIVGTFPTNLLADILDQSPNMLDLGRAIRERYAESLDALDRQEYGAILSDHVLVEHFTFSPLSHNESGELKGVVWSRRAHSDLVQERGGLARNRFGYNLLKEMFGPLAREFVRTYSGNQATGSFVGRGNDYSFLDSLLPDLADELDAHGRILRAYNRLIIEHNERWGYDVLSSDDDEVYYRFV